MPWRDCVLPARCSLPSLWRRRRTPPIRARSRMRRSMPSSSWTSKRAGRPGPTASSGTRSTAASTGNGSRPAMRAALRAVHFLNPYTGWAVGREELPQGGGSAGVILFTDDGGLKWTRLPGRIAAGAELRSLLRRQDRPRRRRRHGPVSRPACSRPATAAGRGTRPPGPRCPTWLACDFRDPQTGVLAGAWGRLATLRDGIFNPADVDKLGGRGVRAIRVQGRRAVAVGQNGLVLLSQDSAGDRWGFADLQAAGRR